MGIFFPSPPNPYEAPKTYWKILRTLVGHLIGTAVIFLVVILLAWLIEVAFYALHRIHPFDNDILAFVRSVELVVVYVDTGLCAVVLGAGIVRFCKDVLGGRP